LLSVLYNHIDLIVEIKQITTPVTNPVNILKNNEHKKLFVSLNIIDKINAIADKIMINNKIHTFGKLIYTQNAFKPSLSHLLIFNLSIIILSIITT
jgi:uncharacterized protein (DUF1697 family)